MAAAESVGLRRGGDRKSEDFKVGNPTLIDLAQAWGVNRELVIHARQLLEHGTAEMVEKVRAGVRGDHDLRGTPSLRQHVRMGTPETSRAKVIARLAREGWENVGGKRHDKFRHPERPTPIIVPRHRTLTPGVARTIAKAAGWGD